MTIKLLNTYDNIYTSIIGYQLKSKNFRLLWRQSLKFWSRKDNEGIPEKVLYLRFEKDLNVFEDCLKIPMKKRTRIPFVAKPLLEISTFNSSEEDYTDSSSCLF
jgi:hypothetical protein